METWVWITVGAAAALAIVGVLAILASVLSERLRAPDQSDATTYQEGRLLP